MMNYSINTRRNTSKSTVQMYVFNMAIKKLIAFLTLVGVALAAPHVEERIVGGTDAVTGEFPYIVSLRRRTHMCGASILDKNHILTAAHCVDGYTNNPELYSIQYGTADISTEDNLITVVKVTIHSEFDPEKVANDIAVLKLESDIPFGANAKPVKLPGSSSVPPGDVGAVLIGWGYTSSDNNTLEKILKKIKYTKFSDEHCKGTEPLYNPNYHVCAGIIGGGIGQCNGDSGGPLTINGVQYGVVSWSVKPCANADHPGILTSVAQYLDWIQENIKD